MIFACFIGVLSALVVLIAMWRVGIDKFMGYPACMDIIVTVILMWMLHGSYVGMTAAVIGGLTFSGAITLLRKMRGYSRLTLRGWKHYPKEWSIPERKLQCLKLNYSKGLIASIVVLFVLASAL